MLYRALVAGPDEVLFSRKGLAVLHDAKFSLSDMTDHSVHHLLIFGTLRSRLKDGVTHRDSLEAGKQGWRLATIRTNHDTWRYRRFRKIRGLRSCGLHNSSQAANPIVNAALRSTFFIALLLFYLKVSTDTLHSVRGR